MIDRFHPQAAHAVSDAALRPADAATAHARVSPPAGLSGAGTRWRPGQPDAAPAPGATAPRAGDADPAAPAAARQAPQNAGPTDTAHQTAYEAPHAAARWGWWRKPAHWPGPSAGRHAHPAGGLDVRTARAEADAPSSAAPPPAHEAEAAPATAPDAAAESAATAAEAESADAEPAHAVADAADARPVTGPAADQGAASETGAPTDRDGRRSEAGVAGRCRCAACRTHRAALASGIQNHFRRAAASAGGSP